jgi:hypothetical protein
VDREETLVLASEFREVILKLVLDNAVVNDIILVLVKLLRVDKLFVKERTLELTRELKELILEFLNAVSVDKALDIDDKLYAVDVVSVVIFELVVDKLLVKERSLLFLKDVSVDKAVLNDAKLYNSLSFIIFIKLCNDVIRLVSKAEYVLKTSLKYLKLTASVGLIGVPIPVNIAVEYREIT